MTPRLLLLALSGGVLLYAASFLLRCRHDHEVHWRSRPIAGAAGPTGPLMLACATCGRKRRHPIGGEPIRFRRTLEALAPKPTGIERMAAEEAQENAEISAALFQIEKSERFRQARQRTTTRFGR